MAETTSIGWTDATFNPWWGCERVSPACAHCYADTFARRIGMPELWAEKDRRDEHGFRFFGDAHWDEPLKWAGKLPAKLGRRPRVFCASMADVFEDRPELEQPRRRLFKLIAATPELDWQLLTKRPEIARDWMRRHYERYWSDIDVGARPEPMPWTSRDGASWGMHPNIWIGASIENARYTWRADVLREIPAAVRFISAEPLLGSLYDGRRDEATAGAIDLAEDVRARREGSAGGGGQDQARRRSRSPLDLSGIDWLIIGGESGGKSRPFHIEHARELLRACDPNEPVCCGDQSSGECCGEPARRGDVEAVPAVFVKQLGAKPMVRPIYTLGERERFERHAPEFLAPQSMNLRDGKGEDWDEWPADLRIREFPRSAVRAWKGE